MVYFIIIHSKIIIPIQPVHAYEVGSSSASTKKPVPEAEDGTPEARWNDAVALSKKRKADAASAKVCHRSVITASEIF